MLLFCVCGVLWRFHERSMKTKKLCILFFWLAFLNLILKNYFGTIASCLFKIIMKREYLKRWATFTLFIKRSTTSLQIFSGETSKRKRPPTGDCTVRIGWTYPDEEADGVAKITSVERIEPPLWSTWERIRSAWRWPSSAPLPQQSLLHTEDESVLVRGNCQLPG